MEQIKEVKAQIQSYTYHPIQPKRALVFSGKSFRSISTLSVRDYTALAKTLPQDEHARFFSLWLINGKHKYDSRTHGILAHHKELSEVLRCHPKKGDKGLWFDTQYKKYNSDFCYRDYWHEEGQERGRCRVILKTGLEKEAHDILFTNRRREQRVYVETGKPVTDASIARKHRERKRRVEAIVWKNPDQQLIADTLHALPYETFAKHLNENYDRVFEFAARQKNTVWLESLQAFVDDPFPFYMPTKRGVTPRVYGSHLPYMPTKLRHLLCPSFIDLDIACCQLTILAYKLDIQSIKRILEKGDSPWDRLLADFKLPYEAREHIKKAVYSIIYGMNVRKANKKFKHDLKTYCGIEFKGRFSSHKLIQDILKALSALKKKILADGGMQTPYEFKKYRNQDMNSFMSCCIQEDELYLIAACYRLLAHQKMQHNDRFRIVLHQHDGISIELKQGADREKVIAQLQKAVAKAGKEIGIPVHLEVKGDQTEAGKKKETEQERGERRKEEERGAQERRRDTPILSPSESSSQQRSVLMNANLDRQKVRNFAIFISTKKRVSAQKKEAKNAKLRLFASAFHSKGGYLLMLHTFGTQNTS